ncbi:ATP-binding protein [Mesorhizobium yinganensis]|uniref:ATP-binding protein n=1 Tax=Mesorhizobium yinganensis TaxID=3157707 RepID=UPI0032B84B39
MKQPGQSSGSLVTLMPGNEILAFGLFQLLPSGRTLLRAGQRVALGGRAFDVLIALVSRSGTVVSSEDLLAQVWPGVFVENGALRVHIAALRKALGDGQDGQRLIVNIPGRGYSFVAPVSRLPPQLEMPPEAATAAPSNLPQLLTEVFGRERWIAVVASDLMLRRFITLVGPGGIGKTTVALAAATTLSSSYRDGVFFLDLAPIADPALVPNTLASILGHAVHSGDIISALVAMLRQKAMLLVLDNCEHVIEVAAKIAEEICKGAPLVHVLATSREPLRARGEHVRRIPPLEVPAASDLTAEQALAFSAVQLFADRAAAFGSFVLSDNDAPVVCEICRRLDGIALAIELAAGRADKFGVHGIAARLNDRFQLLTSGHRTAPARHQTLNATFDWSFELLPEATRTLLRRLSVLAGEFNIDAAVALAADSLMPAPAIAEHLAALVSASLVTASLVGEEVSYRLLESTRAYARKKLIDSGEFYRVAERHATHFRDMLLPAEVNADTHSDSAWHQVYGRQIENLRLALDWASSDDGNRQLAIDLTVTGIPIWLRLSLNEECRQRVEVAVGLLNPAEHQSSHQAMQLFSALGNSLSYRFDSRSNKAWARVLQIARALGDNDYKMRAIRGLWTNALGDGDIPLAEELAVEFTGIARTSPDPADVPLGKRLTGMVFYYRGDFQAARALLERAMAAQEKLETGRHLLRYRLNQHTVTGTVLAKVLWFVGCPDRAWAMAEAALTRAKETEHALTIMDALAYSSCHLAILLGRLDTANHYIKELLDQSVCDPEGPWDIFGRCWRGVLLSKKGEYSSAAQLLSEALHQMPPGNFLVPYNYFLGELAFALGQSGEVARSKETIAQAIESSVLQEERWCMAELARFRGEIHLIAGDATAAEREFLRALALSQDQHADSWALRAAMSLARLLMRQARRAEALELLRQAIGKFREGFATHDIQAASKLVEEFR